MKSADPSKKKKPRKTSRAPAAGKQKPRPRNWRLAEDMYASMHARVLMPLLHDAPTEEEIRAELQKTIAKCPRFYPAVVDLAVRDLRAGDDAAGRQGLERGFELLLELSRDLEQEADTLIDNLNTIWRIDLSRTCLERLVERHPGSALYQDELAAAAARLGDLDTAFAAGARALEIVPHNAFYHSNLGWYHLMAGSLDEAARSLEQSLELDEANDVTQGNLHLLTYLRQQGGTYFDFLLRPVDYEELDRLVEKEDWPTVDSLSSDYNTCRREALALEMLHRGEVAGLPDLLASLDGFFRFVDGLSQDAYFLHEDVAFVGGHFKLIMHKLIVKFGDVDRGMIEGVCGSLLQFYRFLEQRELISPAALAPFVTDMAQLEPALIEKMERYNAVRHDDSLDEDEREEVRIELFDGDHVWPFI